MNNNYDRIRWFVFVQDQMTKKQLISFARSYGISGLINLETDHNVDFNAKEEDLKNQINKWLSLNYKDSWNFVKRVSATLEKNGNINGNIEWTTKEPTWDTLILEEKDSLAAENKNNKNRLESEYESRSRDFIDKDRVKSERNAFLVIAGFMVLLAFAYISVDEFKCVGSFGSQCIAV